MALVGTKALAELWARCRAVFAPKASPALTGTPTAPTAAAGTSSTQIATTAFVASAIASTGSNTTWEAVDGWTVVRLSPGLALLASQVVFKPSGWTEWGRGTMYSNIVAGAPWPVTVKGVICCDAEVQHDTANTFCDAYLNAAPSTAQFPPLYVTSCAVNTSLETTVTVQRVALVRTA